jgi:hypothetical protein
MGRRRLHVHMTLNEAREIAGNLGKPSKLPGFSYGLNARRCRRGTELRTVPGSICSTCYAMTDFYGAWSPVAKGQAKRHDGLDHPRWCDAMVTLIAHHCAAPDNFFRWHDSGDLQSPEHLERIFEVCERTPDVHHWLPTRELADVADVLRRRVGAALELLRHALGGEPDEAPIVAAVAAGAVPRNLVLRLSADMIDTELVIPDELLPLLRDLPTSTVQTAAGHPIRTAKGWVECRAVEARDNHCGPCRACWDGRVANVSYPQH